MVPRGGVWSYGANQTRYVISEDYYIPILIPSNGESCLGTIVAMDSDHVDAATGQAAPVKSRKRKRRVPEGSGEEVRARGDEALVEGGAVKKVCMVVAVVVCKT